MFAFANELSRKCGAISCITCIHPPWFSYKKKEAVSGIMPEHNLLVIQIIILPQCRLVVFCLVLFESFCELRDDNFYVTNDS